MLFFESQTEAEGELSLRSHGPLRCEKPGSKGPNKNWHSRLQGNFIAFNDTKQVGFESSSFAGFLEEIF